VRGNFTLFSSFSEICRFGGELIRACLVGNEKMIVLSRDSLDCSQLETPIFDPDSQIILASDQESVSQYVTLAHDNAVKNLADSASPDDPITDIIPERNSTTEENDDQDDAESLISFSEAEDTIASGLEERIGDVQIPLGEALHDALKASNEEAEAEVDICSQPN